MSRILRMNDRIEITVGDIKFKLAPLSYGHKQELLGSTRNSGGKEIFDLAKAQFLYLKYGLKEIHGIKDYNDEDYKLSFQGDYLTDDCVSEIMNIEQTPDLLNACWQVLNGIKELEDENGESLEGVNIKVVPSGK